MGCGSSKTDALEPRYIESWTKETETTWLTSTDTDIPLSSIHNIPSENSSEVRFTSDKNVNSDIFDDGLPAPAQAYLKVCSSMSEANLNDTKGSSPPDILTSQAQERPTSSPGTTWQGKKMSNKQVSNTSQSIWQMDSSERLKEKSHIDLGS